MAARKPVLQKADSGESYLDISNLLLTNPATGETLIKPFSVALKSGDRLVLAGVAGSGKSSLLRVLAGLWDYKEGEISVKSSARILCVPQKPYLPLLPLREIICYPGNSEDFDDAQIESALNDAGLEFLKPHLIDMNNDGSYWSKTLSGGEQQRLAFARMFLHKPDILLLDEVTSSLDPAGEAALYSRLIEKFPYTTIISVAHREKVMNFHTLHAYIDNKNITFCPLRHC